MRRLGSRSVCSVLHWPIRAAIIRASMSILVAREGADAMAERVAEDLDFGGSTAKIGWVGTGVMGAPMCGHLMAKGHAAIVFNRTKDKASALLEKGAEWADSPGAVAAEADVVFTIVGFPDDVRQVYFGPGGIIESGAAGRDPGGHDDHRAIAGRGDRRGGFGKGAACRGRAGIGRRRGGARGAVVDHGRRRARDGGPDHAAFRGDGEEHRLPRRGGLRPAHEDVQPDHYCRHDDRCVRGVGVWGEGGSRFGGHALVDQQGCGGLLDAGQSGAARGAAQFRSGFFVEHFIKDMGIALREAERMGLSLPGLALVHQIYLAVQAQGHGRLARMRWRWRWNTFRA